MVGAFPVDAPAQGTAAPAVLVSALLCALLQGLHERADTCFVLRTAVVGPLNLQIPAPTAAAAAAPSIKLRELALDLSTGAVCVPVFAAEERGPDMPLRLARVMGSRAVALSPICSAGAKVLEVAAFEYDPWPQAALALRWSDAQILKRMSTSPSVEVSTPAV